MTEAELDEAFNRVKERFDARDDVLGKRGFSKSDWDRTKIAFSLFHKARTVIDIGIGQGQLVSLFCELPHVSQVIGVDRTKHSKFIEPGSDRFCFLSADITRPFPDDLPGSDVTIAMEVFEHIDADKLVDAVRRVKETSRNGMLFASVPYQEKYPLFHQGKPHGHKQSFNDEKLDEVFGGNTAWANFNDQWYLIFSARKDLKNGPLPLPDFIDRVSGYYSVHQEE